MRFYAVTDRPPRPVGYMLLEVDWESDDNFLHATGDTAGVVTVFRSRERAEAECAARNAAVYGRYQSEGDEPPGDFNPEHGAPFDTRYRLKHQRALFGVSELGRGEGLFPSATGVPFFEVVEVELEGLG